MGYLKALLKIALFLFFLLAGGIALYSYLYGDETKTFLIKRINEQLAVEANVKEVDISLWENFPDLSLILHELNMKDGSKSLMSANEVRVKFSLFDILQKDFSLHAIAISNAQIFLIESDKGEFFPPIWKSKETANKEKFEIELRKISLNDVLLHYEQLDKKIGLDLKLSSAWAKGKFDQSNYSLAWNSEISEVTYFNEGKIKHTEKDIQLEAICVVEQEKKLLQIQKAELNWRKLELAAKGNLDYNNGLHVNLDFKKESGKLSDLLVLVNEEQKNKINTLNPNGDIIIDGFLKGELSPQFRPSTEIKFLVENGQAKHPEQKWKANEVHIEASFESKNLASLNSGLFRIDTISALLNELPLQGRMYLSTAKNASLYFQGNIAGELIQLNDFLSDSLNIKSGRFQADLDIELAVSENNNSFFTKWKQGENSIYIKLKDAALNYLDKYEIKEINGEAAIGKNDLYTNELSFIFNGINSNYKGGILNLISFLDSKEESLVIDGALATKSVKLEEIFDLFGSEESDKADTRKVNVYLDCRVDQLSYKKLQMEETTFFFRTINNGISLSSIQMKTLKGEAKGSLIFTKPKQEGIIEVECEFTSIDIHQLFEDFDNFDQKAITSDNLYGSATGFCNLETYLNENSEINTKSLVLNGYVEIDRGKLVNYEPLYELSKYIELEELKVIDFDQLKNQIRIADEQVFIPRFNINSSAINLEMEGTHSFDNEVDYHFSLLLSEIIGKKAKKPKESEFGYIEDDGLGRTQLFLSMKGNIDDPKIKYDKKQLSKHLKKEMKEEKTEIKSILKEEFGLFKKDTTVKEYEKEKNKRAKFEIEWGENDSKNESKPIEPKEEEEKKSKKKGKFGKFIDKIAKPNEEEYISPEDK